MLQTRYAGLLFIYHPIDAAKGSLKYFLYLFYQFPLFGFFLGMAGVYSQYRNEQKRPVLWLIGLLFLAVVLFSSTYMIQRKFFVMSLSFVVFAVWIGEGFDGVGGWIFDRDPDANMSMAGVGSIAGIVFLPLLLYAIAPWLSENVTIVRMYPGRDLPYRPDRAYYLQPWKNGRDGSRLLREDVKKLPDGSSLVIDYTPAAPLIYHRHLPGGEWNKQIRFLNPLNRKFQEDPVKQVGAWRNQVRHKRETTSRSPGLYSLDSHPVYHLSELRKNYDVTQVSFTENRGKIFRIRFSGNN